MTLLEKKEVCFVPRDIRGQTRAWMKSKGLPRIDYLKESVVRFKLWERLSIELVDRRKWGEKRSLIQYEIRNCGKEGEVRIHEITKKEKALGHYCHHRRFHLPCATAYRSSQAKTSRENFLAIIDANDLWGFYNQGYTLPQEVRNWVHQVGDDAIKFLLDVRRAIDKTIKAILGVNTKARNIQPGFQINMHPVSSGNPFKQSIHFQALILPMVADLKNNKIRKLSKLLSVIRVRETFKKFFDPVLRKYGLEHCIRPVYDVHLSYVDRDLMGSVNHAFSYTNRSHVADVLGTIHRVHHDFEKFVCLIRDKKNDVYIPYIKTLDEILHALDFVLNPLISIRQSYGFMRVLEKYSKLLGIERDDYEEDGHWKKAYPIQILRYVRHEFNEETGKIMPVLTIMIRKKDSQEAFRKIKPDELQGELCRGSSRKTFKAKRGVRHASY